MMRDIRHCRTRHASIVMCLLACIATADAAAASLGRLFFTPEQRTQLDQAYARSTVAGNNPSVLVVNGIVQKRDGGRTVWINGVAQNAGRSDERNPDAIPVVVPGKQKSFKVKVGQRLLLDAPAQKAPAALSK